MPAPLYKTGKAGGFSLAGVSAYFTKWTAKVTKEYADSTDSSGFDPTNQQLWKRQAAGSIQAEGSIEGFFDFNVGSSAFLGAVLSDAVANAIFKYDQTTSFMAGPINIMDFDTGVEVMGGTTVGFTCAYKSNGPMSFLA